MGCVRSDFLYISFPCFFLQGLSGIICWRLLVQTLAESIIIIIIYCNTQLLKNNWAEKFPILSMSVYCNTFNYLLSMTK